MALFNGIALRVCGECDQLFIDKSATLCKAPVEEDADCSELQCDLPPVTNFELLSSFRIHHGNPAFCFKSRETGLQVAVIRTSDGPMIKTFITIPTPDQLPRVVDAVIHSGSEAYPWEGAVRAVGKSRLLHYFDSVTSAEETIHYLYTPSSSALGILLPVFMDHLLNPTMTYSAFFTEIYHTDPTGEDGGRLYSAVDIEERLIFEVEDGEAERTVKRLLLRHLAVGSRSRDEATSASRDHYLARLRDPGLRENEAIPFHRKYYRPDNMYIVICGHLDPGEVMAYLDRVDLSILSKQRAWRTQQPTEDGPSIIREFSAPTSGARIQTSKISSVGEGSNSKSVAKNKPTVQDSSPSSSSAWGSRLKSLFSCGEGSSAFEDINSSMPKIARQLSIGFPSSNVEVYVAYPANNEYEPTGVVEMAWLGPSWVTNADEYVALPLLINFLLKRDTKCSVSLYQSMKMKDEDSGDWNPVSKWVNMVGINVFKLRFERVPVPKLGKVAKLVSSAIETLTVDKWTAQEAMRKFLDERIMWDWRTGWEWNGYHHSAVRLTKLMQSGNAQKAESFRMILDEVHALETLKSKDGAFWVNMLHKYLGKDKPRIVVLGYASEKLRKEEEAYKRGRITRREKELGEIGLMQQEEALKCAEEDLMQRRPRDLNSLLQMPNPDDIYVDVIKRYSNFQMVTRPHEQAKSDSQLQAQSSYFSLSNLPLRAIFTNISVHQVQVISFLGHSLLGMPATLSKHV